MARSERPQSHSSKRRKRRRTRARV